MHEIRLTALAYEPPAHGCATCRLRTRAQEVHTPERSTESRASARKSCPRHTDVTPAAVGADLAPRLFDFCSRLCAAGQHLARRLRLTAREQLEREAFSRACCVELLAARLKGSRSVTSRSTSFSRHEMRCMWRPLPSGGPAHARLALSWPQCVSRRNRFSVSRN